MGRHKNETPGEVNTDQLPQALVSTMESEDTAARKHSELIIQQFGDGHPYERVRAIGEARFYAAQSAEAMLELGKRLVLIKEHEPHGEFVNIVENDLGMAARTARQVMQAALKYMSPKLQSKARALALLGKTKLFELLAEDDDALGALTEGGTVAGLTLDEIDRMSSRELRAALREEKQNNETKDKILVERSSTINELSASLAKAKRRIQALSADDAAKELRQEVTAIAFEAEADIAGKLREAFNVLSQHAEETGTDHRAFQASLVRHLENLLATLRSEFQLPAQDGAPPRAEDFPWLDKPGHSDAQG